MTEVIQAALLIKIERQTATHNLFSSVFYFVGIGIASQAGHSSHPRAMKNLELVILCTVPQIAEILCLYACGILKKPNP